MASSNSNGSQLASAIGTEDTLATITSAGSFVLLVDLVNMGLGDKLTIRVKTKVLTTTRLAYSASYSHNQSELIAISVPIASVNEAVFTLEQTAGTERTYPWEIVEL